MKMTTEELISDLRNYSTSSVLPAAERLEELSAQLKKANELIQQFTEGADLLFDDLRSLRSSRICDARDNAKKYLENK
jgi:hypothetical protein